jgi:hypothetical protein
MAAGDGACVVCGGSMDASSAELAVTVGAQIFVPGSGTGAPA